MSELSPRARALFDQARRSGAPSPAQKAALLERLERATPAAQPSTPPRALVPPTPWYRRTAPRIVLVAIVAAVMLARRPRADVVPRTHARPAPLGAIAPRTNVAPSAPVAADAHATVAPAHVDEVHAPESVAPQHEHAVAHADEPPRDDLATEIALLRRAQAARRDGRFDAALVALDAHHARFPNGVLANERQVTRALVLCERGDLAAGRALAAGFASSAWAAALAHACEPHGADASASDNDGP